MKILNYLQNKYNIDITQKSPIEIEGVGRLDLLRWLKELDLKVGVEVGVDRGEYSKLICGTNDQMKLYGVDPWLYHPKEYREYHDQKQLDEIYEECKFKMREFIRHGQYEIIRKKSMDALEDFEDESLDFVYIDANHEAPYVQQDIEGWYKKVKKGGILAGHDYIRIRILDFAIKDALKDFTEKNDIKTWFVLGSYEIKTGVVRDKSRSWMIIKQ